MAIRNPTVRADRNMIPCDGCVTVTLGLTAAPEEGAADIVMLLDRSGSMAHHEKLTQLQLGAVHQLDLMTKLTGGIPGKTLGNGNRLALISYADQPKLEQGLSAQVENAKQKIQALCAGGCTNHVLAFRLAAELFEPCACRKRVIIVYTDDAFGETEILGRAIRQARQAGIIVYCFNVTVPDCGCREPVCQMAGTPEALRGAFCQSLVRDGRVEIKAAEDFELLRLETPAAGHAVQTGQQTAVWELGTLEGGCEQKLTLSLVLCHVGRSGGDKPLFQVLQYRDGCGNTLQFPPVRIKVDCAEPCPGGEGFLLEHCQDTTVVDLGDTGLQNSGRMVIVNTTIKQVCPGKRVAVAVQLTEQVKEGREEPRGMQVLTLPAHEGPDCRDIRLNCIRFAVPEEGPGLCRRRCFRARVFANYLDFEQACCETEIDPICSQD